MMYGTLVSKGIKTILLNTTGKQETTYIDEHQKTFRNEKKNVWKEFFEKFPQVRFVIQIGYTLKMCYLKHGARCCCENEMEASA